jgi:hypothetical protein
LTLHGSRLAPNWFPPPRPLERGAASYGVEMAKKNIDWERIEKEYRLGQKTLRTIAEEFGVSHVAIVKRAKKEQWVQDKSKEVREKTKAGLLGYQEGVTKKVTNPTREDIEVAVQTNIQVITSHRKSIQHGRKVVDLLSRQLESAAEDREDLERQIVEETETEGKADGKRRTTLLKAIALPAHAGVVRDLSTALKNLVAMERQAFNIDDNGAAAEDALSTLLDKIAERSTPLVKDE